MIAERLRNCGAAAALALALTALICSLVRAEDPDKDVSWKAKAEIARRGAMVEHVTGIEAGPDALVGEMLAPPADDSVKWFFTLVVTKGCKYCEQLRSDFDHSPALKPWVDTKDYKKSWAHWQVVQIEDQSQAWRWKDFKPKAFPTLIVQPPFDRSWGDPHTIVFLQEGYSGKPDKLSRDFEAAMKRYAKLVQPLRAAWKAGRDARLAHAGGMEQQPAAGGWTPPVTPPSPLPAPAPAQSYPPADPTTVQADQVTGLVLTLASWLLPDVKTLLLFLTALSNVWLLIRERRQQAGLPLLLDDAAAKKLIDLLKSASGLPPASAS